MKIERQHSHGTNGKEELEEGVLEEEESQEEELEEEEKGIGEEEESGWKSSHR